MEKKHKLRYPIAVEGKYDKNALKQIFDATVITLGGFEIFNSKERQALIRAVARDGIIVLTDSDGGGKVIRSFLNGIVPKDKIFNIYIPMIKGKEKRKALPSREGYLGVEGMSRETLLNVLKPFVLSDDKTISNREKPQKIITKVDFYVDKLTGSDNSSELRDRLAVQFGLPTGMSANALLEALNIISDYDEYKTAVGSLIT